MINGQKAGRRLEAQYAASRILAEAMTLEEATPRLLSEVGGAIGWRVGDVWVVDEEAGVMRLVAHWTDGLDTSVFETASRDLTFAPGEGLPGRVWERDEPVWIPDVVEDRNFPRSTFATEAGLHAGFSFPIRSGGRVLGVIEFFTDEALEEDEELLRAMDAVGSQIGQFIVRTQAVEALRGSDARKSAILESALDCIMSMDHEGRVIEFNPAAEKTFGYTRDEALGKEMAELVIPPSLREQHRAALERYLETGTGTIIGRRLELRGMRKDGSEFPVELAITRVDLPGPPVFTGYVRDITDRKRFEQELREGELRLRQALAAGQMGAWTWDIAGSAVSWSEGLERMHGLEPGSFPGTFEAFQQDIHPEDKERVLGAIRAAVHEQAPYHIQYRIVRPDGAVRWLEARGEVYRDDSGTPLRMSGVCTDVSERRDAEEVRARLLEGEQAARAQAEEAKERLAFLAEASRLLSSSLNFERTLQKLAKLVVPRMADWCSIDVPEDGSIRQLAIEHVDPAKVQLARELRERYPVDPAASEGLPKVLRTGEPLLYPEIADELLEQVAEDSEHLQIIRDLGMISGMVVPLVARGRVLGVISFVSSESGRRFDADDLELAKDLAARAAVAVDNARLYQERSNIARTLQQSLLPPGLPEIPGIEVAARYQPTGEGNQVGGDFYDLFERTSSDWIVAIGDVCGKGPDAAAVTGLARHTLRAAGIREQRPSRALELLNDALLRGGSDRFCTVVCGRIERSGDRVRLTVACGGHPLPHVLRASGVVEPVGEHGTLLGVFPDPEVRDVTVELEPGDAVIFYTDGVVEDRRPDTVWEKRSFSSLVQHCAFLGSADAIADCLEREVHRLHPEGPQDDIAIVVLRVTP